MPELPLEELEEEVLLEPPLEELEEEVLLEESELGPEFAPLASDPEDEASPPETFFFLPVLKSVSYHPLPFSLKAAADTNFASFGALHAGHILNGSSDIFCNFSNL